MSGNRKTSPNLMDRDEPPAMEGAGESDRGLGIQGITAGETTGGETRRTATGLSAKLEGLMCHTPVAPPGSQPPTVNIGVMSQSLTVSKTRANPLKGGSDAVSDLPPRPVLRFDLPQPDDTSQAPVAPQLGNLLKRRASTSPEKFNTGQFEALPLQIDAAAANQDRPKKRVRLESRVEIDYDSSGTPRIACVTPVFALPSGKTISATLLLNQLHLRTPTSSKKAGFRLLDAICEHNDILLIIVSYLTLPALTNIYSISKTFHRLFNHHPSAYILSCMRTWAPDADQIYPWRCYKSLCFKDPTVKVKAKYDNEDSPLHKVINETTLRDTPSLRWLQMVVWRQGISKDMLIHLASKGLRCPTGTHDAVKRLWFIMDLPINAHRIALCRSEVYLSNEIITLATHFLLKLDMHFTDPAGPIFAPNAPGRQATAPAHWQMSGFVGCDLRELLFAERSMTPLWRTIRGMSWDPDEPDVEMSRLDMLRLWIRHRYVPSADADEDERQETIMGIPWNQAGKAGYERAHITVSDVATDGSTKDRILINPALDQNQDADYDFLYTHQKRTPLKPKRKLDRLLRPDELMIKEAVRREMSMHKEWVEMMLWGFSDERGRALPLRTEEELLAWSKGKKPLSYLKTDGEILREREEKRRKREAAKKLGMEEERRMKSVPAEKADDAAKSEMMLGASREAGTPSTPTE